MAFILKTATNIRNNWKKSLFAAVCIYYGANYGKNHFETQQLMREYCAKAVTYGNQPIPLNENPRSVTIVLNPNANKRKANDSFEKYCAPLLHLAGILVEIVKTESEGHAKTLMEGITNTDAIVIAGGDGTLSEVVTGLLRRTEERTDKLVPIGVLPLGKNNTFANKLFSNEGKLEHIQSLADATMAVIENVVKPVDVMKIEVLEDDTESKPIYAVGGLKWGAFRDAEVKKENYWYFGGLKKYATYIFNGYKDSMSWDCNATLKYSPPCDGCSNCINSNTLVQNSGSGWFKKYVKQDDPRMKLLNIKNPECEQNFEKEIVTSDLSLLTSNMIPDSLSAISKLQLTIGPDNLEYLDFVKQGFNYEHGEKREVKETIEARMIELKPKTKSQEAWFSIDNENFEVKPVRITILPKVIKMFCKKDSL